MNKTLNWIRNKKKTVRKLVCHLDGNGAPNIATCTALLQINSRNKRSFKSSGLRYPWTDCFEDTREYKQIIFPWINGEDFDLDNKRIIPIAQDIDEENL